MKYLARAAELGLTLALLIGAPLSYVTAQTGITSLEDCRCVDANGDEIENCRCFRTFEPGDFAFRFTPFGASGARIGITLSTSTGEENARGAYVQGVMEDGPAERAGIREGDVITHIDGRSLFDPLEDPEGEAGLDLDGSLPSQRLLHLARALEPGEEVEIRFIRDGQSRSVTVEAEDLSDRAGNLVFFGDSLEGRLDLKGLQGNLEDLTEDLRTRDWENFYFQAPEGEGRFRVWTDEDAPNVLFRRFPENDPQLLSFGPGERGIEILGSGWEGAGDYFNTCPESDEGENRIVLGTECIGGLRTEEMNPNLGAYFGTSQGVLVTNVHEDSKLGLEAGDVILRVGDREAHDPDRFRRILRSYEPDEEITLHIMRQKREMEVTGTLGR